MFVSTDWKFSGIPFFLHFHQSCWMKILHDNMYYCRKIFQIIFWYKCQQKDLSENQWPLMQNFTQWYNLNLYCSQESSLGNFTMDSVIRIQLCSQSVQVIGQIFWISGWYFWEPIILKQQEKSRKKQVPRRIYLLARCCSTFICMMVTMVMKLLCSWS